MAKGIDLKGPDEKSWKRVLKRRGREMRCKEKAVGAASRKRANPNQNTEREIQFIGAIRE